MTLHDVIRNNLENRKPCHALSQKFYTARDVEDVYTRRREWDPRAGEQSRVRGGAVAIARRAL